MLTLPVLFPQANATHSELDKILLGNKGWGLVQMGNLGMPIPPGMVLCTDWFQSWQRAEMTFDGSWIHFIQASLAEIPSTRPHASAFGDASTPLLVSVRSGAATSMPGMMDTVLNVGLNREGAWSLARQFASEDFAMDVYRRLLETFGKAVHSTPSNLADVAKSKSAGSFDKRLSELEAAFLQLHGVSFPQDPWEQLHQAIVSVWRSWNSSRAQAYRTWHGISDHLGTAVVIQSMVFGNLNDRSATGVVFTRNPNTGEKTRYGEFLPRAQGEDVVAGTHTPWPLSRLKAWSPTCDQQLDTLCGQLEHHLRDMQDIEFTIEDGRLWLLQTRSGKRSARSMVQIATDLVQEGILSPHEALQRIQPEKLLELSAPTWGPRTDAIRLAQGLPACPGVATGPIALNAEEALAHKTNGTPAILVRSETSPEDVPAMQATAGILTKRGGMTSHAAVVARGLGMCCVVGCNDIAIDEASRTVSFGSHTLTAGDWISIDGYTGEVFAGQLAVVPQSTVPIPCYETLMEWAHREKKLQVRANADTPADAARARQNGAVGIGLCRTEHMFFAADRIPWMQRMILARGPQERAVCLDKLEEMQRQDFLSLFQTMDGLPVTVRLLDPPLHEFLPKTAADLHALAETFGLQMSSLETAIAALQEQNPMLGLRGCRLGILHPDIYTMQIRALLEASRTAAQQGITVRLEIMIPLVADVREFLFCRQMIEQIQLVLQQPGGPIPPFLVGTMIETPRACLIAGSLAPVCDFFSFGTNDLTQMTLGLSRDDAGTFLPLYAQQGIYPIDPFLSIDTTGVGVLIQQAIASARSVRKDIKLGICGEHGGDPASIAFFHQVELDYVSCSPSRIGVAILACAKAALTA